MQGVGELSALIRPFRPHVGRWRLSSPYSVPIYHEPHPVPGAPKPTRRSVWIKEGEGALVRNPQKTGGLKGRNALLLLLGGPSDSVAFRQIPADPCFVFHTHSPYIPSIQRTELRSRRNVRYWAKRGKRREMRKPRNCELDGVRPPCLRCVGPIRDH